MTGLIAGMLATVAAGCLAAGAVAAKRPTCHGHRATIVSRASTKSVVGTPGPDVIVLTGIRHFGDRMPPRVEGRGDDDIICGAKTIEFIDGGSGDDWIDGGGDGVSSTAEPNERYVGGPGRDIIHTSGSGYERASGGAGADELYTPRNSDAQELNGGAGPDVLHVPDGWSTHAHGGGGDDRILSEGGSDQFLTGDGGDDVIRVTASASDPDDELAGGGGSDRITGGAGDERIYGGDVPGYKSTGRDGADVVDAGGGNDKLYGGAGSDKVSGGDGADRIALGSGKNRADGGAGTDTVEGGDAADHIAGGGAADLLEGAGGEDVVSGGDGDDRLHGGTGDDSMFGRGDTDHCSGEAGADSCDGGTPTASDPVNDVDICDPDVEHPKDCRTQVGRPTTWTGTFTNSTYRYQDDTSDYTWTESARLTYTLDPNASTSSYLWAYRPTGTIHASISGVWDNCTVSGEGTVPVGEGRDPLYDSRWNYLDIWPSGPDPRYSISAASNQGIDVLFVCPNGSSTTDQVAPGRLMTDSLQGGNDRPTYRPAFSTLNGDWQQTTSGTPRATFSMHWGFQGS